MKKKVYYMKGDTIPQVDDEKEKAVELETKDFMVYDMMNKIKRILRNKK